MEQVSSRAKEEPRGDSFVRQPDLHQVGDLEFWAVSTAGQSCWCGSSGLPGGAEFLGRSRLPRGGTDSLEEDEGCPQVLTRVDPPNRMRRGIVTTFALGPGREGQPCHRARRYGRQAR